MSEPPRLSVFIIARNEAARLARTLDGVAFADEVVLVDSGSTDGTIEIAEAHGARVLHFDFKGYGPQKAFAERACRYPWRLNVDADEEVTPELAGEIRKTLSTTHRPTAFTVAIHNVYPGEARPRPFANDYRVVRLYHRDAGAYRDHPLFDRVDLGEGVPLSHLKAPIHHHAFVSWEQLADKLNRYSSYSALNGRLRPRALLLARLPFEFPVVFLKSYLVRRHIFGGWKGLAFATVQAFFRTLRLIKLLERAEREARSTPSARPAHDPHAQPHAPHDSVAEAPPEKAR